MQKKKTPYKKKQADLEKKSARAKLRITNDTKPYTFDILQYIKPLLNTGGAKNKKGDGNILKVMDGLKVTNPLFDKLKGFETSSLCEF